MNAFDWAILAVLLLSTGVSLFRGFIKEAFSLLVWALAFWVAFAFSGDLRGWLTGYVDTPSVRAGMAFVGLFVLVLIVGGVVNYLLGKLVESTGLSATDRMLGAVFGLVRGLAMVVLFFLVAGLTPMPQDSWWRQARVVPYLMPLVNTVHGWLPESVGRHIRFEPPGPADKARDLLLDLKERVEEKT